MGALRTDHASAPGKWGFVASAILGVVLVVAAIWSLIRTLNHSSPHGTVAVTNEAAVMDVSVPHGALEGQELEAEQAPASLIQAPPVVPAEVVSNKQSEAAVELQKATARVNQVIVERMKKYVRDNPGRDNSTLEKQIKKREMQTGAIQ